MLNSCRLDAEKKSYVEQRFFREIEETTYLTLRNAIVQKWISIGCSRELSRLELHEVVTQMPTQQGQTGGYALAVAIIEVLARYGHIYFGVMADDDDVIRSMVAPIISKRQSRRESAVFKSVVVVGAGAAGLMLARHLNRLSVRTAIHLRITVLEARDRVGGRVFSPSLTIHDNGSSDKSSDNPAPKEDHKMHRVDAGAQIITGFQGGNPLDVLVRKQLKLPISYINDKHYRFYGPDGAIVDPGLDRTMEKLFNHLLDVAASSTGIPYDTTAQPGNIHGLDAPSLGKTLRTLYRNHPVYSHLSAYEHAIFHWHIANLEFANCCPLDHVDHTHWDQDDDYAFSGRHALLNHGYQPVMEAMATALDIQYHQAVRLIKYRDSGIELHCDNDNVFQADLVAVTVPLGVLKAKGIEFDPRLPTWKSRAFHRVGFGCLNKLILVFESVFWPTDAFHFGSVSSPWDGASLDEPVCDDDRMSDIRGECYLFLNAYLSTGKPILIAFNSGLAALHADKASTDTLLHTALSKLRRMFGTAAVSPLVDSYVSRWGSDKYARGSYSYVKIGSSGHDYDLLAHPLSLPSLRDADRIITSRAKNMPALVQQLQHRPYGEEWNGWRVFFAGEATCRNYPATVHGALLSGLRDAAAMMNVLDCSRYDGVKARQPGVGVESVQCFVPGCGIELQRTYLVSHFLMEHMDEHERMEVMQEPSRGDHVGARNGTSTNGAGGGNGGEEEKSGVKSQVAADTDTDAIEE